MNVDLPGGIGSNLVILGPFTTFIIIIIASAIPAIMMFTYFKKIRLDQQLNKKFRPFRQMSLDKYKRILSKLWGKLKLEPVEAQEL